MKKMKWKNIITNMTIKKILQRMTLTCVLIIFVLFAAGGFSNFMLARGKKQLIQVARMEKVVYDVSKSISSLNIGRFNMLKAERPERLDELNKQTTIDKLQFTEGIEELKNITKEFINSNEGSDNAGADDGNQNTNKNRKLKSETVNDKIEWSMAELDNSYKQMETNGKSIINAIKDIFDVMKNRLNIEKNIEEQAKTFENNGSYLHQNARSFSEKIEESIDKYVHFSVHTENASEALKDGIRQNKYLQNLTEMQKQSNALKMNIAFLTDSIRQIMMAEQKSQVLDIQKNTIPGILKDTHDLLRKLTLATENRPELKTIIQDISKAFYSLESDLNSTEKSIGVLQKNLLDKKGKIAERILSLEKSLNPIKTELQSLNDFSVYTRAKVMESADFYQSLTLGLMVFFGILGIIVIVCAGHYITGRIIKPVDKLIDFAGAVAEGDLTAEIVKDNEDEIGELVAKLSEMIHGLNMLIGQVQRSGIQVTSSATELSATSKQQEAVMKTQLESTNYVVGAVGEISDVSGELVETVQKVAAMSEQTAAFATSGQTDLSHMEDAMRHMENASKSISGKLEAINDKAANITSVVTTITKVADQTNLLSLNAAIEAEKAGEYGRGFTVVAREIRRLADQTAVATLDIDQMVQEMQSAVSAGVMEMDAFIAEVQKSAENVGKISMQLTRIIEQVQALSPSFEGVNESMQFQSENSQKINSSMVNLSEEMQQTVESLRESFMAIEQLNDAARGLQEEVSRFKVA